MLILNKTVMVGRGGGDVSRTFGFRCDSSWGGGGVSTELSLTVQVRCEYLVGDWSRPVACRLWFDMWLTCD